MVGSLLYSLYNLKGEAEANEETVGLGDTIALVYVEQAKTIAKHGIEVETVPIAVVAIPVGGSSGTKEGLVSLGGTRNG